MIQFNKINFLLKTMLYHLANRNSQYSETHPQMSTISIVDRVTLIAYDAIKTLVELISFPFRYIGTKFGLRYQFFCYNTIPKNELLRKMDLVYSTAASYHSTKDSMEDLGYNIISPSSINVKDKQLEKKETCFFDPLSGLKVSIFENNNSIIVALGTLNSHKSELSDPKHIKDLYVQMRSSGVTNLLGFKPKIYSQVDEFFSTLILDPHLKGKEITLTGHCFGGSLASYVALKHGKKAFCINSLPLGAGLQQDIGKKRLKTAPEHITQVSIQNDWLTDSYIAKIFDIFLSSIFIKTPGRFGKKTFIPSAFKDSKNSHNRIVSSCKSHLGLINASSKQIASLIEKSK